MTFLETPTRSPSSRWVRFAFLERGRAGNQVIARCESVVLGLQFRVPFQQLAQVLSGIRSDSSH